MPPTTTPRRTALVVLNPAAGHHRTGRLADRAMAALAAAGLDATLVRTEGPRHAEALAREATADLVIAAGGDGTVQEVAAGLASGAATEAVGSAGPALGVLPLGTGNDFARLVGMPRGLDEAASVLATGEALPLDALVVRWLEAPDGPWLDGLCVNALGIGFDASVAVEVARFKRLPGQLAYLAAVLKAWRAWQRPQVRIERLASGVRLDERGEPGERTAAGTLYEGPLFLADLANGRAVGGGFRFTPTASPADGLLDLVLVDGVRLGRLPALLAALAKGHHLSAPELRAERLPALRLTSDRPIPLHFDGEVLTQRAREVEVRVRRHVLRTVVGSGAAWDR